VLDGDNALDNGELRARITERAAYHRYRLVGRTAAPFA
jgi:hypothetical protein